MLSRLGARGLGLGGDTAIADGRSPKLVRRRHGRTNGGLIRLAGVYWAAGRSSEAIATAESFPVTFLPEPRLDFFAEPLRSIGTERFYASGGLAGRSCNQRLSRASISASEASGCRRRITWRCIATPVAHRSTAVWKRWTRLSARATRVV